MKVPFLVFLLFMTFCCDAQVPFKAAITGTGTYNTFNSSRFTQTITHDQSNNIVFISNYQAALVADWEIHKMSPSGTFLASYKYQITSQSNIMPMRIVNTSDDGFLVAGFYDGQAPAGFPAPPGLPIHALFYAKFDNNLNLLTFRINAPGSLVADIGNIAVSDADGNGAEEYVLCYTNVVSSVNQSKTNLVVLDINLNPIQHKEFPLFKDSRISYLPNNNLYALTGGYRDRESIALLDANRNFITPIRSLMTTQYHPFRLNTGVIEQASDPNYIIWSFLGYPSGQINQVCNTPDIGVDRLNTFIVKMDLALNIIAEKEFIHNCAYFLAPVAIHNNPSGDGFAIGTNQMNNVIDGSGVNVANTKGGLMTLDYDLNLQSSYIYNPYDLTYDNHNGDYWDDLRYFRPITTAIGDSYILHLSFSSNSSSGLSAPLTRIINAYPSGLAQCSEYQDLISTEYVHQVLDFSEGLLPVNIGYATIKPPFLEQYFNIDFCGIAPRPTAVPAIAQDLRIFPNPVSNSVLYIEGKIPTNSKAVIIDLTGRKVLSKELTGGEKTAINLSGLASGVYYLSIWSSGTIIKREKLIIN